MDITQQYFTCKKCGESKIWGEYFADKRLKYGVRVNCKKCCKEYKKKYRRENKDKVNEANAVYYSKNVGRIRASWRKTATKFKQKRREYHALNSSTLTDNDIKYRLKAKGFTREQIEQNPELINIQRIIIQTKRLCKT